MSADLALRLIECLVGWSTLLQTLEYFKLRQSFEAKAVWDWSLLKQEMPTLPKAVMGFFDFLFDPHKGQTALFALRLVASISLLAGFSMGFFISCLFVLQVLILFRFRGAFNGGSDFMTLVVLSGLMIHLCLSASPWAYMAAPAGLGFIGIQLLSSYFVSGWVKLRRAEWRGGQAMIIFLDAGVYGPLSEHSLFRRPMVAKLCSWSFIIWEGLAPISLFGLDVALAYVLVACVFHFLVFWFFGLNRFFWAWLAAMPSLIYWSGRIF
jgi:hypothetical protein